MCSAYDAEDGSSVLTDSFGEALSPSSSQVGDQLYWRIAPISGATGEDQWRPVMVPQHHLPDVTQTTGRSPATRRPTKHHFARSGERRHASRVQIRPDIPGTIGGAEEQVCALTPHLVADAL
jgi:hypothetical protein